MASVSNTSVGVAVAPESTHHQQPRRAMITAIVVLWLLIVFDGYDLIVFGTVRNELLNEWSLSQATTGTIGSMAFLGMMIGAVFGGRLSDSLGRKRTVWWCTIVFTAATVLCAVAPNPMVFGALRFVAGLGLGALVPSANALASALVAPRYRSMVATLMMSGVPIGGSLAALTGIPVIPTDWFGIDGWRWMFVFPVVAVLILLPLVSKYVPDSVDAELKAQAEAAPEAPGFGSLLRPPYLVVSILFALATLATLFAWYGLGTELPNLMSLRGADLGGALVFSLVLNLGAVAGSLITAWAGDKWGPLPVGMAASLLAAVGLFVIMLSGPDDVLLIYVMLVLAGVGTHGTQSLIIGAVTLYYPDRLRGTALGWALGVGRLGAVLAPQTAGLILGSFAAPADGVNTVFMVFASMALVAAVIQLVLIPMVSRMKTATAK